LGYPKNSQTAHQLKNNLPIEIQVLEMDMLETIMENDVEKAALPKPKMGIIIFHTWLSRIFIFYTLKLYKKKTIDSSK
jgi:hypothetical protein